MIDNNREEEEYEQWVHKIYLNHFVYVTKSTWLQTDDGSAREKEKFQ